jgi:hypothetical protein
MNVEANPGTMASIPRSTAEPPISRRKMERKPQMPAATPSRKEKAKSLMERRL